MEIKKLEVDVLQKMAVERLLQLLPEWSVLTHYRITKGYVRPSKKYLACLNSRLNEQGKTVADLCGGSDQ